MPCPIANSPKLRFAGASRSQLQAARHKREPKPCVPFRAVSSSVAWATESPDATEVPNSPSTSLADVADELLRRERERQQDGSSPSSSADRLQEQLALQLDRALLARDGIRSSSLAFPGTQQVFMLPCLHAAASPSPKLWLSYQSKGRHLAMPHPKAFWSRVQCLDAPLVSTLLRKICIA